MGSFLNYGPFLRVLVYKGAALYWGPKKGTLIQRTTHVCTAVIRAAFYTGAPFEFMLKVYCFGPFLRPMASVLF